MEIVLATSNPGKIKELQAMLAPIQCVSQSCLNIEAPPETGLSFIENALLKARYISTIINKPVLADDSGLVVAALNGQPGIYSARYAGLKASNTDNINKLLANLKNIPDEARVAFFYCALVIMRYPHDPTPLIACGRWDGIISHEPLGYHGFGYDPIFYLPSHQCTAAQLPQEIKNKESHRAQALIQLRQQLLSL